DLRLLHVELCVDVLDAGLRGRNLGLRRFESNAIVAVVDAGNHVACGDMLVVGDRDGGEITGHLRGKRELPRRDESIVGGLKTLGVVEVEIAAAEDGSEKDRPDGGDDGAAMQHAVAALLAGWRRLPSFRLRGYGLPAGRAFRSQGNPRLLFPGLCVLLVGRAGKGLLAFKLFEREPVSFQNIVFVHHYHSLMPSDDRTVCVSLKSAAVIIAWQNHDTVARYRLA